MDRGRGRGARRFRAGAGAGAHQRERRPSRCDDPPRAALRMDRDPRDRAPRVPEPRGDSRSILHRNATGGVAGHRPASGRGPRRGHGVSRGVPDDRASRPAARAALAAGSHLRAVRARRPPRRGPRRLRHGGWRRSSRRDRGARRHSRTAGRSRPRHAGGARERRRRSGNPVRRDCGRHSSLRRPGRPARTQPGPPGIRTAGWQPDRALPDAGVRAIRDGAIPRFSSEGRGGSVRGGCARTPPGSRSPCADRAKPDLDPALPGATRW